MFQPVIRDCSHCGNEVRRNLSTKRNGEKSDKVFCNRECYDAFRKEVVMARTVSCKGCGSPFIPEAKASPSKYCSMVCRKAKPSECKNCGCEFTGLKFMRGKFTSINGATICSKDCYIAWLSNNEARKRKISKAFTGTKHPNWKGGLVHRTSRGPGWRKLAERIRKRDGYVCQGCGIGNDECLMKYGRVLDVDHIVPFHNFTRVKDANHPSNLQSMCASCHRTEEATRVGVQMSLPIGPYKSKEYQRGDQHHQAKLNDGDVIEIRRRRDAGETIASIASSYRHVTRHTVGAIAGRRSWRHVR